MSSEEPEEVQMEEVQEGEPYEAEAVEEEVQEDVVDDATPTELNNTFDELLFIQLGDTVELLFSNRGPLVGSVYYRSNEQLHVKSLLDSNALYIFEYEDNDEEEIFKEHHNIQSITVIKKRAFESFVEQQDFRIGEKIDTFARKDISDTTYTDLYNKYTITDVKSDEDSIVIEDEEKNKEKIEFEFIGIPLDMPFIIISPGIEDAAPESDEQDVAEEKELLEEEEEDDEVVFIGSEDVIIPEIFREAEEFEQNIPDSLQKIDALNDYVAELSSKDKNDPKVLRKIRILIETLFYLKNTIIAYNADGTKKGIKQVSARTLTDLIDTVHVPLGRPVLNVSKKLYITDPSINKKLESAGASEEEFEEEGVACFDFLTELREMFASKNTFVNPIKQKQFLKRYLLPWIKNEDETVWSAISDSDFFRMVVPEVDEGIFEKELPGYLSIHTEDEKYKNKKRPIINADNRIILDKVAFGIERALTTTYNKGTKRLKEPFMYEESAPVVSYLLFPLKSAPYLGNTRSNLLAIDSGVSGLINKTMKTLLGELGTPVEGGTSNNIQLFNPSGTTIGNIELADYINGLSIDSLNISDMFYTLQHYGINDMELSVDLYNILSNKMTTSQNVLKLFIKTMRDSIQSVSTPSDNYFIKDLSFLEKLSKQNILNNEIENYKKFNPSLVNSDIGMLSYIMKKYADYLQVTAGDKLLYIMKAKHSAERLQYLENQRNLKLAQLNEPYVKPRPNFCKHVGLLNTIRRKHDDTERFTDLTLLFKKYQGPRNDNWIDCNVCNKNLICIHERLQIQGFLSPAEKASIDKEIILKFAGGQFQGRYICRNCGQPIRDFTFDTNIEFDENGVPKSGNAVLVDKETEIDDKLDTILNSLLDTEGVPIEGAPIELSEDKILLLTPESTIYYSIIIQLSQFMMIEMKRNQIQNIIDNVIQFINFKLSKTQEKKGDDKHKAILMILSCTVYMLIEIQCAIPSYTKVQHIKDDEKHTISYNFNGYPLDTNKENKITIEYFSIGLLSCIKDTHPWSTAGFNKYKSKPTELHKIFVKAIPRVFSDISSFNELVELSLYKKRVYLEKTPELLNLEKIPSSFLPEPIRSVENVIIPEVANNNSRSRIALINYWIRKAHQTARDNAVFSQSSSFSEITCCRKNVAEPDAFWNSDEFNSIEIGLRGIAPKNVKMLLTTFIPRESNADLVQADEGLYYRLFLKCCFTGPRRGYPHEPGLTNKCTWCEFQFPGNPRVMDFGTEGKAQLATAEVLVNYTTFNDLLNAIHINNSVPSVNMPSISDITEVVSDFANLNISYNIIDTWSNIMNDINERILKDNSDDIHKLSVIAETVNHFKSYFELPQFKLQKSVKEPSIQEILKYISNEVSWMNFFDIIQTYLIVPMQRVYSNFDVNTLNITIEMQESLSKQHISDVVELLNNEYIAFDLNEKIKVVYQSKSKHVQVIPGVLNEYAQNIINKLYSFITFLSSILEYKNKLCFRNLAIKTELVRYIKELILYGSLHFLLHPDGNVVLLDIITKLLRKFYKEKITFDSETIKNMIEIGNEKERVKVIKDFDKLSPEEKAVELMNKRLGLGKWSVGGTKVIYAYDKDYYDLERQRRLDAGIIDFPGLGNEYMPDAIEVDDLGFEISNEEEDGYDHAQQNDD
jgi:hypothetical protein